MKWFMEKVQKRFKYIICNHHRLIRTSVYSNHVFFNMVKPKLSGNSKSSDNQFFYEEVATVKKDLEQAVEHANETNPRSRSGGKPSTSKKTKMKKTNRHS